VKHEVIHSSQCQGFNLARSSADRPCFDLIKILSKTPAGGGTWGSANAAAGMGGQSSKEGESRRRRRDDDEETVYDGADDALFLPPCRGAIAFFKSYGQHHISSERQRK
jgi:hypothetical protein